MLIGVFGYGTRLSVMATTWSAYLASIIAYPKEPQVAFPFVPLMLPYSSELGAPMKATSMWMSPAVIARARPPCERITTGFSMIPLEIAAPNLSRKPDEVMFVMTPFLMCSINGSCTFAIEEGAIDRFLIPIFAISSITMLMT